MLKFIHQLPQNLIGLLILLFLKDKKPKTMYGHKVYVWGLCSAISLGNYIFVDSEASEFRVLHEAGHQRQSLILGWLYLLIIGLPSFVWCSLKIIGLFRNKDYYSFYPERWANSVYMKLSEHPNGYKIYERKK